MRIELYGIYMTENMCAASGLEMATTQKCQGDRNCSLNADCKPITNGSIIKTGEVTPKINTSTDISLIQTSLKYTRLSNIDISLIQTSL